MCDFVPFLAFLYTVLLHYGVLNIVSISVFPSLMIVIFFLSLFTLSVLIANSFCCFYKLLSV